MIIIILLLVSASCFLLAPLVAGVKSSDTKMFKEKYEQALKDGNKADALEFGRKYFRNIRWSTGYNITIYDEQRIQNDINVYCNKQK
jgi:hypothetical protein